MNLIMIRPKNQTEVSIFSLTKNCQTLIEETHTRQEGMLEFKMMKPREIFNFDPPIQINGEWMLGLTDLEVYNSIFNITEQNNKLKLYNFSDEKIGGFI